MGDQNPAGNGTENDQNSVNVPKDVPRIEVDKNGVMNLTTKSWTKQESRASSNPQNQNFPRKEPIVLQPQVVVPNFIKYDLVRPSEGFQYLHFMVNEGFATADLRGNAFNVNYIGPVIALEAPAEAGARDVNGNAKRRTIKGNVPPFLKRNRGKSAETAPEAGEAKPNLGGAQNDGCKPRTEEDDVIFMGEYRKEDVTKTNNEQDVLDDVPLTERAAACGEGTRKRKRGNKNVSPTRRNPKRKVQIEKKSVELAMKLSEGNDFKKPKKKKSAQEGTNCRRSARQLAASGCIYVPPKPLGARDFKNWPVHGMHERPEYDPVKAKVHPFDYTIRSIKETCHPCRSLRRRKSGATVHEIQKAAPGAPSGPAGPEVATKNCRGVETLRHVLGYICQKKNLYLNKLRVVEDTENNEEVVFNHGKSQKLLVSRCGEANEEEAEEDKNAKMEQLKKLLFDCCLLHCATNNVNQSTLAMYLMNFDSEVAVDWLNNQILQEAVA